MMKKNIKSCVILVTALIGLVIYLITSLTGYLGDKPLDTIPLWCTIVGAICIVWSDAQKKLDKDILLVAGALCLIGAMSIFAMGRVQVAEIVWFIPVNRPAAADVCLYLSVAGIAMYLIAVLTAAVKAFTEKE